MEASFKELLSAFMLRDYINHTPLNDINPENLEKCIPLQSIYLGVRVMEGLKNPVVVSKPEAITDFFTRCRHFMAKLCKGIQERYNFNDPVLKMLPILHPSKALSSAERMNTPSLLPMTDIFPRCKPPDFESLQRLDDEWRQLSGDNELPEEIVQETDLDVFYHKLSLLCHSDNISRKYVVLPKFSLSVLSLPHSNAECERAFSKYNLVKTKLRNRLLTEHVEGVMLASQAVKSKEGCCSTFKPSQDMRNRMNTKNLYGTDKLSTSYSQDATFEDLFEQ
ncbi:hypothetical protein O0L34_g17503 [Tuta absoluta]|nr:hypothetical protein O0L34_g17503 [Tuta absoluta]